MATKGTAIAVTYWAINATTGIPLTGDKANHTLSWAKDGAAPASISTPTIQDNGDGSYTTILTTGQATCNAGQIVGSSSTSNVYIYGVSFTFEDPVTALLGMTLAQVVAATSGFLYWMYQRLNFLTPSTTFNVQGLLTDGAIYKLIQGSAYSITIPLPATTFDLTGYSSVRLGITQMPAATGGPASSTDISMVVNNVGNAVTQSLTLTLTASETGSFAISPWPDNPFQTDPRQKYAYRWTITFYPTANCDTKAQALMQGYFNVQPTDGTACP